MITGETGAGKTMVVTALGLLLGGRADTGAVRTGAAQRPGRGRRCGSADLRRRSPRPSRRPAARSRTTACVLARNVSAEGRSRAFAGGASVPVSALADVAEPLVAVHGQSDQHRLLQPRAQRDALDRVRRREHGAGCWRDYRRRSTPAARRPSASSTRSWRSARERAREADLLRFGLGEIEAVDPQPGEDAALAAEESRLGLRRHPAHGRRAGPRGALRRRGRRPTRWPRSPRPARLLDGVREHDPEAGELADRLAEITYLLSDLAADVASYASRPRDRPGPAGRASPSAGRR